MKVKSSSQLHVDNIVAVSRFYKSLETSEPAKFKLNLDEEAPKLQAQIVKLTDEDAERFSHIVNNALGTVDPKTKRIMAGAAIGGAVGVGGAGVALGITEISNHIGNPVIFALSLTALGIMSGVVGGSLANRFSAPPPPNTKQSLKLSYKNPAWSTVIFGEVNTEIEIGSKESPQPA